MPISSPQHRPLNHVHTVSNPSGTGSLPYSTSVPPERESVRHMPNVVPGESRPRHEPPSDAVIASLLRGGSPNPAYLATPAARERALPSQSSASHRQVTRPAQSAQGTTVSVKRGRDEGMAEPPPRKIRDRAGKAAPTALASLSAAGSQPIQHDCHVNRRDCTRSATMRGEPSGIRRASERSTIPTKLKRSVDTASPRPLGATPTPMKKKKQRDLTISGFLGPRPARQVTPSLRRSGLLMSDVHHQ